jgi:hypothetical protein
MTTARWFRRAWRKQFRSAVAVFVVLCSAPNVVAALEAEEPEPDNSGGSAIDNTVETSHYVTFSTLSADTGQFTVTREFSPRNPKVPMSFSSALVAASPSSVITSFAVQTDGTWRAGQLRRYTPASPEKGNPRRPYVSLRWDPEAALINLDSAPFEATTSASVRYELWSRATRTARGFRWTYCPEDANDVPKSVADFRLTVDSPELNVRRSVDEETSNCYVVERPAKMPNQLSARYGRYFLGNVWWWRIESIWPRNIPAASQSEHPVVLVIDASKSQATSGGIQGQMRVAKAMAAAAPHGSFEIVLVNRFARRVFGRFASASELRLAADDLAAHAPLANGSFLDRGLVLASQSLTDIGKPGRIIAFSDGEVRSQFNTDATVAQLRSAPKGTVIQLVAPERGEGANLRAYEPLVESYSPLWESGLGMLAAAFGGKLFELTAGEKPHPDEPSLQQLVAAALLEQAIEPPEWSWIALRDPSRTGSPEWPANDVYRHMGRAPSGEYELNHVDALTDIEAAQSFAERSVVSAGQSQTWSGYSRLPPPARLVLSGQAMGRIIHTTVEVDHAFEQQLSRLANSEYEVNRCLGERNHHRVALASGFLAPSLEFFVSGRKPTSSDEEVMYNSRNSSCGYGRDGGWQSGGGITRDNPIPDCRHHPIIENALKSCHLVARQKGTINATIEVRTAEVLDVAVVGKPKTAVACATEALWSVDASADREGRFSCTIALALASE